MPPTDPSLERIKTLEEAVYNMGVLFWDIRNDWSDPRYEIRLGMQIVNVVLGREAERRIYDEFNMGGLEDA